MGTIEYSKLIRDRIPEIIESAGKQAIIKKVQGEELLRLLNLKLEEELAEYNNSGNIEELADLVEVIYGILEFRGITLEKFDLIRKEKRDRCGGFKEGLVLLRVIEE